MHPKIFYENLVISLRLSNKFVTKSDRPNKSIVSKSLTKFDYYKASQQICYEIWSIYLWRTFYKRLANKFVTKFGYRRYRKFRYKSIAQFFFAKSWLSFRPIAQTSRLSHFNCYFWWMNLYTDHIVVPWLWPMSVKRIEKWVIALGNWFH